MSSALSRRELLQALGGGLLFLAIGEDALGAITQRRGGAPISQKVSAWIHIAPDGQITVFTGKVEVGQNARTSLTAAAAEELRVPTSAVKMVMGDTDLCPYDAGTFGSQTTPRMVPQIRRAAATAREALIDLAATQLGANRADLKVAGGKISAGSKSVTYGELAKAMPADKEIPAEVALTPAAEWKILGTSVPKVDAHDFVTGRHQYTVDLTRPGMLRAKILRPPSFGAKLTSLDASQAQAMPGVLVVHDGDFVGVAAPTTRLAERALVALKPVWQETPGPSSKNLEAVLRGTTPSVKPKAVGGDKTLDATYSCAYIAHVPLEPRAALAEWDGQKMTVHTGTQRPFGVKQEVAQALGIPESQVRVIMPDTGSGYGGKHSGDAAVEAARMAKALNKPIKLIWTRQEEFTFAYFRPGGVDDISASVKNDGTLVGWEFDNYNSGSPGIETPYDVPNPRTDSHQGHAPLRQGSYRCLGATFNNFARESHMDDLAKAVSIDPLAFRLQNLKNNPRMAGVLKAAADKFGWGASKPSEGHGFGLACGAEKGSYVATVAEVAVDPDTKAIRVVRQVTAYDCGAVLNPDHLRNQIEGAVIMGIGGALFEAIEFENGRILNARLSRYRVPRHADMPKMETMLIDHKDIPATGAGEVPIMAIAPAIGNAIHQATGTRLRSMPMRLQA